MNISTIILKRYEAPKLCPKGPFEHQALVLYLVLHDLLSTHVPNQHELELQSKTEMQIQK